MRSAGSKLFSSANIKHFPVIVKSLPPKGYEANNPAIEYLKLKSWIGFSKLTDADLTSKDLIKKTITSFEVLKPLLDCLNEGIVPG